MNILFVNNFYNLFDKADCGASQRSMCLIRALVKIGHVDVVSFVDDTVSNVPNVDVVYSRYIENAAYSSRVLKKLSRLFKWRNPYAIYPENKQKSEIIDRYVQQNCYDIIVIRYLYLACDCGLLKYSDKLIIDYDDDLRDVTIMDAKRSKSFRNKIYCLIYSNTLFLLSRHVAKCLHHQVFYSSPKSSLPNSVFLPNISALSQSVLFGSAITDSSIILMVGNYRYFPNEFGLLHFLNNVYPKIRECINRVELRIVGNVPKDVYNKIESYNIDGVTLCGFVPDIVEEYKNCRCVVVPIYQGTGTSVKLVEALTLGKAVVTTSVGKRGLHPAFQDRVDYLLADSDEEFARNVVRLLTDVEMNEKMCQSASKKAQMYYSEDAFNRIVYSTLFSKS